VFAPRPALVFLYEPDPSFSQMMPRSPTKAAGGAPVPRPQLLGIHHVRIPVSDVTASTNWYTEVFGLSALLIEEEENEVVGAVLSVGDGPGVGLHHDPSRAVALAGFCVVAIAVDSSETLSKWSSWLDQIEAVHTGIIDGPLGRYIDISDPDGLIAQLHTLEHPSVEES
jgi:catechol 2,3-dioxygenase-like lactoylglutathione lyase family enzyme